ncbi:cytosolic phospholipase A2 gamma-like [Garra rufa]|uniref:cytosolic phospholipase A2 gamma-like n=1 Tax=Garra rufa TaxID=137080 RepID=UPI003CCEEBEB
MSASKHMESAEVRIKHCLNKNELEFVAKRRNHIHQSLKKLKICCNQGEVPNIALLGSGGGQRAMVGLLGSLDQLQKAGLLDCILYLSGVSGSTWCMASLYQEPDWSTQLEVVKDTIIHRLIGPAVTRRDAFAKLKKYYYGKDIFSLTDVWAVLVVTSYVKEIDEHPLTDQQNRHDKDPFPIYTAIDKQCKQSKKEDPWFELTPFEAGYSNTGAFVDAYNFGSQFENGYKIKHQPEIDMLYLQALCGSALADREEIMKFLWEKIKEFFKHLKSTMEMEMFEDLRKEDSNTPPNECYQVLMDLVDMNLSILNGKDPSALDKSIRTMLNKLAGDKNMLFQKKKLNLTEKEAAKQYMKQYTVDICNSLSHCAGFWPLDICFSIVKCMGLWIWGRKYDFLHNMTEKTVPSTLLESETRDYIDAGLLLNSPYFSVLREDRDIDLIISLDFSDGDPFKTVKEAAAMCGKLNIPFPEVNIPSEEANNPKDVYVFKCQNAPTVIHMPLFNVVNCGDKVEAWKYDYRTFQGPYSHKKITKLLDVAGENISNNKDCLLEQIRLAIWSKILH